ncbi:aldehyde dehydrogenase family 3 member B1-like [Pyxicephalus adspersus]|uniref:aldehyde dehydrogenase family 3 member B1-like n=1 Tax=Pyxicephalus adspersus TaxID=30357 RepID=UPI003B5C5467
MKPSEINKNTEKVLSEGLCRYLDQDCFAVVCGGVEESTRLLAERFDYIFFTGNPTVGKIVMGAATKHLTPVTLELGGKNPCYVHDDSDIKNTARRIAWSRFLNAGQTCLAPDYILVERILNHSLCLAGHSGMGMYHGKFTFDTFSHKRACLLRSNGREKFNEVRYPPYSESQLGFILSMTEEKRKGGCVIL